MWYNCINGVVMEGLKLDWMKLEVRNCMKLLLYEIVGWKGLKVWFMFICCCSCCGHVVVDVDSKFGRKKCITYRIQSVCWSVWCIILNVNDLDWKRIKKGYWVVWVVYGLDCKDLYEYFYYCRCWYCCDNWRLIGSSG